jgi:hypothetical protein
MFIVRSSDECYEVNVKVDEILKEIKEDKEEGEEPG